MHPNKDEPLPWDLPRSPKVEVEMVQPLSAKELEDQIRAHLDTTFGDIHHGLSSRPGKVARYILSNAMEKLLYQNLVNFDSSMAKTRR